MLTVRQKQTLTFIEEYMGKHGIAPSYDEMMEGIKCASKANVKWLVGKLAEKGYLKVIPRKARAMEIINNSSEWRPIETAPKTGEPILVYNDNWGTCIGRWTERKTMHSFWEYDGYEGFEIDFTHWMPLPNPPVMENNSQWPLADDK